MRENGQTRRRRDSDSSSSSERDSRRRGRASPSPILAGRKPHLSIFFAKKKDQNEDQHQHNHWWFLAMACCLLLPSPLGGKDSIGISLNSSPPSPEEMFFTPDFSDEHFFDAFKTTRPLGIRWRGDAEWFAQRTRQRPVTLMPVLVQQQPNIQHHRQHLPSSSRSDDEPSLEEIELIDVLWRSDLSGISEKGTVLERQEESDLAALTHKSITGPLSQDEALRYEELSKGYFEDFYAGSGAPSSQSCHSSLEFEGRCYSESSLPSCSNPVSPLLPQQQQSKSSADLPTPTDAELDALFNEMLHKDSSLEHSLGFAQHPLMHNVSLGVPLTQSNLTEVMPQMNFACESQCGVPSVGIVPATPSIPSAAFNGSHFWNNHTEGPLPPYLRTDGINNLTMAVQQMCHSEPVLAEIGAVSTYHTNPLHNVASLQVPYVSNHGLYDHFGSRRSLSISNESSIDSSSTSSSASPRYNSEAENHSPNQSRFYGKLLPNPMEEQEKFYEKNRLSMSCSVLPRRRGRQSKDEQLAMSFHLPATAALISDMSLPELQKMLRSEDLSEEQKALIRKIRRRGKNKVAARTCRQRRGEMKGVPESPQPNGHLTTWNSQIEPSRTLYRRQ